VPDDLVPERSRPPPATRTAVFPIAGVLAGLALTTRSIVLRHSGDPDLLDGGVDRSSSGRPAMPHPPAVHLSGAHRPGAPHGARGKRHSGQDQATANLRAQPGTLLRSSDDAIRARLGAGRQLIADEGVVRVD
jgi:hypothetical protein